MVEAARAKKRAEVVAGQERTGEFVTEHVGAAVEDALEEDEGAVASDHATHRPLEDGMIDRGEKPHDVHTQAVAVSARPPVSTVHGGVRALTLATRIRVGDEAALEERVEYANDGVVHDPIAKGCGGDEPPLGLVNVERAIGARTIDIGGQLVLKVPQLRFEIEVEVRRSGFAAARASCEPVGGEEIFEGNDALKEMVAASRDTVQCARCRSHGWAVCR